MQRKSILDDPVVGEEIRARIGKESEHIAPDEVCPSEIRRYVQATMDDNPLWYDEEYAKSTKFGPGRAPGAIVLTMVSSSHKRPLGTPDPVRLSKEGVNFDIHQEETDRIPWQKIGMNAFHGGDEVEYLQLPRVGDHPRSKDSLVDVTEKTGRSGRLVVTTNQKIYTNQRGEVLCIDRGIGIVKEMHGDIWKGRRER